MIRELEEKKRIPIIPVVVDSPMASQATQVYNRWHEEHDREYASILANKRHPLRTASMSTASSREESKHLNELKGSEDNYFCFGDVERRTRASSCDATAPK
ncbi:MAG: hypothetical protein IPK98_17825 [Chloracidobacterium sp.]|nr:hypothetical protein [Chloracidobacterium sp.]